MAKNGRKKKKLTRVSHSVDAGSVASDQKEQVGTVRGWWQSLLQLAPNAVKIQLGELDRVESLLAYRPPRDN